VAPIGAAIFDLEGRLIELLAQEGKLCLKYVENFSPLSQQLRETIALPGIAPLLAYVLHDVLRCTRCRVSPTSLASCNSLADLDGTFVPGFVVM
jgi:hypothetical protein